MVGREDDKLQRVRLEKATEDYIQSVVPSQRAIRPEVMEAYRCSDEKFRSLYQKLAEQ